MIEREVAGIAEAMRDRLARAHRATGCSRAALAGIRGGTLIVNFPGSPRSIEQIGGELAAALRHALALLAGGDGGHPPGGARTMANSFSSVGYSIQ